jgi:hypothetical protein
MGCLASLVSFASCLLPSRASTGAGSSCYLFNKCMFSFQNSSYSTVLLAVAEPVLSLQRGTNWRTRCRRLGRSAWGQPHLVPQFYRANRLWLSCCR